MEISYAIKVTHTDAVSGFVVNDEEMNWTDEQSESKFNSHELVGAIAQITYNIEHNIVNIKSFEVIATRLHSYAVSLCGTYIDTVTSVESKLAACKVVAADYELKTGVVGMTAKKVDVESA